MQTQSHDNQLFVTLLLSAKTDTNTSLAHMLPLESPW